MTKVDDRVRTRARPLSSDDRRTMIIDAVLPLLIAHGHDVTTKAIAEAAGIAEGTIFRVFPDKDALFTAAIEKFLDPTATNRALRAIDPEFPLEAKVTEILRQLQARMSGIFGIMHAVGMSGPLPHRPMPDTFNAVIADVLGPDLARLGAPIDRIASFVRLIAWASEIPQFNHGREISTADYAHLITYGIAGHPAEGGSTRVA